MSTGIFKSLKQTRRSSMGTCPNQWIKVRVQVPWYGYGTDPWISMSMVTGTDAYIKSFIGYQNKLKDQVSLPKYKHNSYKKRFMVIKCYRSIIWAFKNKYYTISNCSELPWTAGWTPGWTQLDLSIPLVCCFFIFKLL